ncbi:UDP-3-O-(3-hydroxymyristoyl)glucosamine N-acyltransferase [Lacihabitans sp. LS3-19]|uniref:UDP-3-O-(3-hydroxymyristoyl)glucosamine N-acyltransferase n=2 Tax=Lacihabitans sp. LS3-19 TaxID=2487335 RepID=UPI0020CCF011|nr:UDP-3-O-(3-hydroxymyristoyl)glucosamine N-acyltransferase [Lacihabitans sp. LS3-19]MCP9767061.1 UDP-3-O-(3-hydroxymyristoyl)glucosamine N-acyltransferase [Lacihabitans sp. LS3-19]
MEFSINQIALLLGGEVVGNGEAKINNFAKIEEGSEGCISFLANLKYENFLYSTQSTAVLVSKSFEPKQSFTSSLIKVDDPYLAISSLMAEYKKITSKIAGGISEQASIAENAKLGVNCFVGAFSFISQNVEVGQNVQIHPQVFIGKNVKIGDNTILYTGVKIYENCEIGSDCIIHANAVIGADGFGFVPNEDGIYQDVPQLGNVIIENNVSIGANATIDRATMGSTKICKGVKIDNLVQIGHNVEVGENTVIAAQTGVAGSTKIGKSCIIGGQVGFAGHLKIADGTQIGAQSGVGKNINEPKGAYSGRPLLPIKDHLKLLVNLRRLNDNLKK